MPLVVHYWADLQSVHELRCYGNITQTQNVSEYMLVLALCLVAFMCTLLVPLVAVIKSLNEKQTSAIGKDSFFGYRVN